MQGFMEGLQIVLQPQALILIAIGVPVGIIFGAIPGLSATMAIALCLPLTYHMSPEHGLAMLLALYVGAVSGGLISAILINIPGTPASVATCFDGHPMVLKGEAGKALVVALLSSLFGGFVGLAALIFISPALSELTLKFGTVEYFAIGVFSLTLIASLAGKSMIKGLISAIIGMTLALVGTSAMDNMERYTFGVVELRKGFETLTIMVGMFAVTEMLKTSVDDPMKGKVTVAEFKLKNIGLKWSDLTGQIFNAARSALIGTSIGILPGLGGNVASLLSYSTAKSASKNPEKFGTGCIDGIIASEAANNAVYGGAMIPLLTLGIPGDSATALLLGGFMVHGIVPGPMLFKSNAQLIYSIFAAMMISNLWFFIVEYVGLHGFVKILKIRKNILLPVVIVLCAVGCFGSSNRVFDVICMAFFGLLGYLMLKAEFPVAPLIMGFILEPIIENNFRRGYMYARGDMSAFFLTHPIAMAFYIIAAIVVIATILQRKRTVKNQGDHP
jgi:putative tricarboxylic transport membrane protein